MIVFAITIKFLRNLIFEQKFPVNPTNPNGFIFEFPIDLNNGRNT